MVQTDWEYLQIYLQCYKTVLPYQSLVAPVKKPFQKVVESKMRSTMAQERLDTLLAIFIEQKIANSLDMEEIIDDFKIQTHIKKRPIS